MFERTVYPSILLFFLCFYAAAQQTGRQCKWVVASPEIHLDSLTVLPSSIRVYTVENDSLAGFSYNPDQGILKMKDSHQHDSVRICYQTLPYRLGKNIYHRNLAVYDSNAYFQDNRARYKGLAMQREELFSTGGLQKTGSISRGISFGNRQDVFVNSALNLQLDGKLTDDINIRAAISDQSVPFQPEGNTQQLQEFDKVFIQLYNDDIALTAGDVVLKNKPSAFLRFYKNVQGGHAEANYKAFENSEASTTASISVARGKFASIRIEALEGVPGPYRLRGPGDEKFIIVLANSEKVYVDGQLMQRGYNYDYTIDYNRGEITFTPKVVITKYSRIRVDFEYSDRNYSRAVLTGSHYQQIGKFNIFTNYYREKDNRNRPLAFDLSSAEKQMLSQAGDGAEAALLPGVDSVGFDPNLVLYKKVSMEGGNAVYVFSTDPDSARYQVSFSDVGMGNGHYIERVPSVANGKVYQWVAPVNGIPQGNYAPVIAIPTPNQKQMVTAGANYQVTEYGKVYTEAAFSNHDTNLFSTLGGEDNKGSAITIGYTSEGRPLEFLEDYTLSASADYTYNDKYFRPVDRYRPVEFDRDWNYVPSGEDVSFDDHNVNASLGIAKDNHNLLRYRIARRKLGNLVDGVQQEVALAGKAGRFQVRGGLFSLDNNQRDLHSNWVKIHAGVDYISRTFVPGYTYTREKNKTSVKGTDSVVSQLPGLPVPMNYQAHTFSLKSNDSLRTQFNFNYTLREDDSPIQGKLQKNSQSRTANLSVDTQIKENHDLNVLFTYRTLKNYGEGAVEDDLEETIMGQLDWVAAFFDGHLNSGLSYTASNGRELKREFVFLKVPTGEGTHTWRDENQDGIKDLGEFYLAINPDERNYAKIFTPTDDYILAFSNTLNYTLDMEMPRNWRKSGGLKGVLSRFSNSTSWRIDKKHTDRDIASRFIPFKSIQEAQLLSIRESFRSSFFFNRANPVFGLEGTIHINERKALLTNGFESRENKIYQINARYNVQRIYNFRLSGEKGYLSNASDFLHGRNYRIGSYRLTPELEWQPGNNFRLTASYSHTDKQNLLDSEANEAARIDALGLEARLSRVSKGTLQANIRYYSITFRGEEDSALGYELLQALRPGDNFTWSVNLQQKLVGGLQVTLNYEGRKSEDQNTIHTGRMQVSALF